MTQEQLHDQLDAEVKKLHEVLQGIVATNRQAVVDITEGIEYITQLVEGYVPPKPEEQYEPEADLQ
jgi:hypothetical protein